MAEQTQQPQVEAQQAQTPAPQASQPSQQLQKAEPHPLHGIQLGQLLVPFAQQFAAPMETFLSCFEDKSKGKMAFRREVEYAVQAMTANSFLVTCAKQNPQDLVTAIQNIALTGLSLNPVTKQAYLVPFKSKITFMPSYAGMRDLLVRTGLCTNIEAHLVYTDDYFSITYGEGGRLEHRPAVFSKNRTDKDVLGGYFIATLPSGQLIYDTMSVEEIDKIYKQSPSYGKQSPWQNWWQEMAKKTLIRRGFKSIPHTNMTEENLKVIEATMKADDKFYYDATEVKPVASHSDFDDDIDDQQ